MPTVSSPIKKTGLSTGNGGQTDANAVKAGPPASDVFKELLESAKNLPNSASQYGTVLLGLNEIKKRTESMLKDKDYENDTKA